MAHLTTNLATQHTLAGLLVIAPDATENPELNITNKTVGSFNLVRIDNIANAVPVYVKMKNGVAASPGTDHPDWIFYGPAGSVVTYAIPLGAPYSLGLSLWCVTGAESTSGASNTGPTNDVIIRVVAS
mgnify:CR=1 FL=1|jgi:hypothetical protein